MRLFLTGRYSVARAIALALLPGRRQPERHDDHFLISRSVGEADRVSWCGGHLLQMAPPEHYDPRYHRWRLEDLPIFPPQWDSLEAGSEGELRSRPELVRQLRYLREILPAVSVVIHAGDPDREGQWLVDEVLTHLGWTGPVQRLLLPTLNAQSLRRSLREFEKQPLDNHAFEALSLAAQTRSRADWLYGLNLTRACTLLGRRSGYEEVLSVGRVQTPLLGLVVQRDEAIEKFQPHSYYQVRVKFRDGDSWCLADPVDEKEQVRSFENVADAQAWSEGMPGKPAQVESHEKQHHVQVPPMPLDLSALQIECADRFGYPALETLRIARRLYEEHHLITYPASECRYLPEFLHADAEAVIAAIVAQGNSRWDDLANAVHGADTWRKSSAWDNRRVTTHHGIIPVARSAAPNNLSEEEYRVYSTVARYYLAQFFTDREIEEDNIRIRVGAEMLRCSSHSVLHEGWQMLLPPLEVGEKHIALPVWEKGCELTCEDIEIKERRTRPPLRYTESRLMEAMTHIPRDHGMVSLGTESTRAQMLDALFRRGYLMRGNKTIFSTSIGRSLIHALPESATCAEEMVRWELKLSAIEHLPVPEARQAAQNFLDELKRHITEIIQQAVRKKNIAISTADELLGMEEQKHHCPRCHSVLRLLKGRRGVFWGCAAYPACQFTAPDRVDTRGQHTPDFPEDFHPQRAERGDLGACPKCGAVLKKRQGKHGGFYGCSAYPACTYTTRHISQAEGK